jgi:hypothetical protein
VEDVFCGAAATCLTTVVVPPLFGPAAVTTASETPAAARTVAPERARDRNVFDVMAPWFPHVLRGG